MIIDIHTHYTTEPAALHRFRDQQLAGVVDPARAPTATSLAALGISDEDIVGLNIPNGQPLVYELDADLKPIRHYYLGDAAAAAAAAAAVGNQGKA